jgi:flagellin
MFGVMRDAGFSVNQLENGTFSVTASSAISAAASDATGFTDGAYTGAGGAWAADTVGADPTTMINTLEVAIDEANDFIASLGVAANRIETQNDFVKSLSDTLTAGVSTLVDADLAEESAVLQSLQTKQQLGLQALSIANQQSGAVLSLFR